MRLSWKPPKETGNSHPTELQYRVKYCKLRDSIGQKETWKNITVNETNFSQQPKVKADALKKENNQSKSSNQKQVVTGWRLRTVLKKVNVTVNIKVKVKCKDTEYTRYAFYHSRIPCNHD